MSWKRKGRRLIFVLLCTMLTGCGTTELENRKFPLTAAIDSSEDVTMEWLENEQSENQAADYNHLKVIILGKSFLEDGNARNEFLSLMEQREDIPQNTYVVVAENAKEILELGDHMDTEVGTYIEEMLETVSPVGKEAYPTIGTLCSERVNQMETVYLPYLIPGDEGPVLSHYYAWKRGEPVGEVSSAIGLLANFTEGDVENYTLELKNHMFIQLFDEEREIDFQEKENQKIIVVNLKCKGGILQSNREELLSGDYKTLEAEVESYMNQIAEEAKEQQLDVSNSFKQLGGGNREWYSQYTKTPKSYEQEIQIHYHVEITWVSL